ncbi:PH domain-containing protein [Yinghuangia sp. YIM S10712]|uniref:PH domain-containing protein n=1 Tax=Yinghuangia sp. YIM S10712 TaxID=3436930 RepID=UPI003F533AEF
MEVGSEILDSWVVERDGRNYYAYKARIVDGRLGPDVVVWTFRVAAGVALLAGILALLRGGTWWREATRLHSKEVAARSVLVRAHRPGLVAVYPADDTFGRLPMFLCRVPFLPRDGDRLSEAVLYGDLRAGAAVALTVPDTARGARTEISASALHPIRPSRRAPYRPRGTEITAEQMTPRRAPVVWTWPPRWTVAADRDGIHLGGPVRRRHVPWDDVASVTYQRGTLVVTTRSGRRIRVVACHPELAHSAAVLDAMRKHPALRPADTDTPPPTLPLLLLTAGAAAVTALVFLLREL